MISAVEGQVALKLPDPAAAAVVAAAVAVPLVLASGVLAGVVLPVAAPPVVAADAPQPASAMTAAPTRTCAYLM